MLGQKLRDAGFLVEEPYYADILGYLHFVTRLFKAIGNDRDKINPFTLTVYDRVIFPVGQVIEKLVRVPGGKNVVGVARNVG